MPSVTGNLRAEIEDLLTAFTRYVDASDAEAVAALFTEDGVIQSPHFTLNGRAEILTRYGDPARKGSRISKHTCCNLYFAKVEDDRVEVEANSLVVVGQAPAPSKGGMLAAGVTYDVIVRQDGAWRFASRRLEILLEAALPVPAAH